MICLMYTRDQPELQGGIEVTGSSQAGIRGVRDSGESLNSKKQGSMPNEIKRNTAKG